MADLSQAALITGQDQAESPYVGVEEKGKEIIMEIKNATSVGGVRSSVSQAQADSVAPRPPSDHVSTADTSRMADLARAAQAGVATLRTIRLARIEKSIHAGTYHPTASEIASRLLDAAEIDHHMQALLRA